MKQIELTSGKFAIVDDEDYDRLVNSGFNWFASSHSGSWYAHGNKGSKIYKFMHHVVMNVEDSKLEIDHKNGNGLDNRKSNLRICTHIQNAKNRKVNKNSKTGYKGVQTKRGRFQAVINSDNKRYFIGTFDTPIEAAKAYNEAAERLHGEFSRLNKI